MLRLHHGGQRPLRRRQHLRVRERAGPLPSTLHCVDGACVCDETVCSGCCQGVNCLPGDKKQSCGSDGGACRNCTGGSCVANRCQ